MIVTSVECHTELDGRRLRVIDLPGTYSLHSFSPDEAYVMHELAKGKVDVVLNVIDVNNLERNLLLTMQLRTMGKPVVCVLNMYDEFTQSGSRLDLPRLRERLGMPCVTTIARTGQGITEALRAAIERAECTCEPVAAQAGENEPRDVKTINTARYRSISKIVAGIYQRNEGRTDRATRLLDRLTAHGLHAYLVYAALMFCAFWLTFELGQYPMDWIDSGVGLLTELVESTLPDGFLRDLLVSGVLGGVGSVIVFLPNILILYLCITLLEDSGYLARAHAGRPLAQPRGAARQVVHSDAHGLRLQRAGRDGHAHDREPQGAAAHDAGAALHVVLGEAAGLRDTLRRVLPR